MLQKVLENLRCLYWVVEENRWKILIKLEFLNIFALEKQASEFIKIIILAKKVCKWSISMIILQFEKVYQAIWWGKFTRWQTLNSIDLILSEREILTSTQIYVLWSKRKKKIIKTFQHHFAHQKRRKRRRGVNKFHLEEENDFSISTHLLFSSSTIIDCIRNFKCKRILNYVIYLAITLNSTL